MADVSVTPREIYAKISQPDGLNYRSSSVCRTFVGEIVQDRSNNKQSREVVKSSLTKTVPVKLIDRKLTCDGVELNKTFQIVLKKPVISTLKSLASIPSIQHVKPVSSTLKSLASSPSIQHVKPVSSTLKSLASSPSIQHVKPVSSTLKSLASSPSIQHVEPVSSTLKSLASSPSIQHVKPVSSTLKSLASSPSIQHVKASTTYWHRPNNWLDVRGRSMSLQPKVNELINQSEARQQAARSTNSPAYPVNKIPKSRSVSEIGKDRNRTVMFHTDNSRVSPVKTEMKYDPDFLLDNDVISQRSDSSECQRKKRVIAVCVSAKLDPSKLASSNSVSSKFFSCTPSKSTFSGIEPYVDNLKQYRPHLGINKRLVPNVFCSYDWKRQSVNDQCTNSMCDQRSDSHLAVHRTPVSSLHGCDAGHRPLMITADTYCGYLVHAPELDVGSCSQHLRTHSPISVFSKKTISAPIQQGPWATSTDKTHYILQWLADVDKNRESW